MDHRSVARRNRGAHLRRALAALLLSSTLAGAGPGGRGDPAAPRPTADSRWLDAARREIARIEYGFRQDSGGLLSAPNRRHGLRVRLDGQGLTLEPRTATGAHWWLSLDLVRADCGADSAPPETALLHAEEREARLDRGSLVEWYVNSEAGLEQGFTLAGRPGSCAEGPAPTEPLVLEMAMQGTLRARTDPSGENVLFSQRGELRLRYGNLEVRDALGRRLPAALHVSGEFLQIRIEQADAVYPLEVDPLFSAPFWTDTGGDTDRLGVAVAAAGDVNGDGYGDLLLGVERFDFGTVDEGAAFLYYGSSTGPSLAHDWRAEGQQTDSGFGVAVASAGDVNGDGFDDILVGAPQRDNGHLDEGAAFLWLGSAAGPAPAIGNPGNADWSYEGNQQNARLGTGVARAGDVNGDGRDDVLVGAPRMTSGQQEEGKAFLFLGVPGGLAVAPAWTAESNQDCTTSLPPTCLSPLFGASLGSAGDVNGDGYDDILIGSPQYTNGQAREGTAYVWHGGPGFGSGPDGNPGNANWYAESNQVGSDFGIAVASAGDVDGDGFADILIGARNYSDPEVQEGKVFLWMGGAAGLGTVGSPANADWTAESNVTPLPNWGLSVGTAGDVNGDGYADVVIGARSYPDNATSEGGVFVWFGGPGGMGPAGTPLNPDWSYVAAQAGDFLGSSVAAAGDVNGDGFGDLIAGAPFHSEPGENSNGQALLFLGGAEAPAPTPGWEFDTDQADAGLDLRVASAGDVNGDGFGDVLVSAPAYDGTEKDEGGVFVFLGAAGGLFLSPSWTAAGGQMGARMGAAAGSAGDVNGDGFGDVVVGAPLYDDTLNDQGAVFVWFGGPASVGDPAGLGPDGTPANADWSVFGTLAGAELGAAVASAGDVNGDGFADLILGAPGFSNPEAEEGTIYVHPGSASGPGASIFSVELNVPGGRFGAAVDAAGDVNGDGFGDFLAGAPEYTFPETEEGIVLAWLGSGAPLSVVAHWAIEGNQAFAHLGAAVAGAGDLDGDGYGDVVTAAPGFTGAHPGEGAATVWLGSAAGLDPLVFAWQAFGGDVGVGLGTSVGPAGDVNLDGVGDLLIGSPGFGNVQAAEGHVGVWYGGGGGLGATGNPYNADWFVEGGIAGVRLGTSAAGALDVNGDGIADVLAAAPLYDDPETDEGRAVLHYGGGRRGLARVPQQFRSDDAAPIYLLGRSDGTTDFRLHLLGRTPAGRGDVTLLWEIKPLGTPFDGTGLVLSPLTLDTGAPGFPDGSAALFDAAVLGLAPGSFYRWRARILTDSPVFPRSPWLSPMGNGRTETDLRTDGCLDEDGDGYGRAPDALCAGGPVLDCDDSEPASFPGNPEVCDGLDNNCDSLIDEGDPGGGAACNTGAPGVCADGITACNDGSLDCDPITPPSPEICDGLDNDCDGTVPAEEVDDDRDGLAECEGDCNDADFGSLATPLAVTGLQIAPLSPGYRFTWDSQDLTAGRGTVYDVYTGAVSSLGPAGDFSTGSCLQEDIGGFESYDDMGPDPPPREVFYYMLRGQNLCPRGTGTYGTPNRDATAALGASPCL